MLNLAIHNTQHCHQYCQRSLSHFFEPFDENPCKLRDRPKSDFCNETGVFDGGLVGSLPSAMRLRQRREFLHQVSYIDARRTLEGTCAMQVVYPCGVEAVIISCSGDRCIKFIGNHCAPYRMGGMAPPAWHPRRPSIICITLAAHLPSASSFGQKQTWLPL
jgi:hypothetical protein